MTRLFIKLNASSVMVSYLSILRLLGVRRISGSQKLFQGVDDVMKLVFRIQPQDPVVRQLERLLHILYLVLEDADMRIRHIVPLLYPRFDPLPQNAFPGKTVDK